MHSVSLMVGSPYLRWWFTAVFALPGLYFLVKGLVRGTAVDRVGDGLHVLMCSGMVMMVSPVVTIPVVGQVVVFAVGTLWFAGLVFVRLGGRRWHQECAVHAHHAIMMAGMVWMTAITASGGHAAAVPRLVAVVTVVLAVLFLISMVATVLVASQVTPGQGIPLPVAADMVMTVGMSSMILVMVA